MLDDIDLLVCGAGPVRTQPRSVCLVADDGEILNPEANAARLRSLALSLHSLGWSVHILDCSSRDPGALHARFPGAAIDYSHLDDLEVPVAWRVRNIHGDCPSDRSDRVRLALLRLHAAHPFDLIEFPALGGLGFRTIQSQRAGLAFSGVLLAVRLDVCTSWLRQRNLTWPSRLEEVEIDFIEQYAFQHAGIQIGTCRAILDHVRQIGWRVRPDVFVFPDDRGAACEAPFLASAYEAALFRSPPANEHPIAGGDSPLVSICVPHYNLGRYLPETLGSLAEQTYGNFEVLVIDDGSTDPASLAVFEQMRLRYPHFRFVNQPNVGIGATRNRGLREARGSYFLPMDADNIARPDMLARLVAAIHPSPDLGAVTCSFLAFQHSDDLIRNSFVYAYRPTGGPHVLASMRNVYGDATALYRVSAFRAVGGYETDRGTSFEDWEAFVKLVNAGYRIDVVPEHLFYYRHRPTGFSRTTNALANHQRVLRQFRQVPPLATVDRVMVWSALVGAQQQLALHAAKEQSLRYRIADAVYALCCKLPIVMQCIQRLRLLPARLWGAFAPLVTMRFAEPRFPAETARVSAKRG